MPPGLVFTLVLDGQCTLTCGADNHDAVPGERRNVAVARWSKAVSRGAQPRSADPGTVLSVSLASVLREDLHTALQIPEVVVNVIHVLENAGQPSRDIGIGRTGEGIE